MTIATGCQFAAWMAERASSTPEPDAVLEMTTAEASALMQAAYGEAGFHEAVLVAPLMLRLAEALGVEDGDKLPPVKAGMEFRVTWQRQGMGKRRSRFFQSERAARRHVAKLTGQILEWADHPGREPSDYWCCDQSYGCNCGGMTVAERVAHDHADVPPMTYGPVIEARPVGDWAHVETADPDPRELWEVDAHGQPINPMRVRPAEPEQPLTEPVVSVGGPYGDDIPF